MTLLQRASKLLQANINQLLDNAEDPEVTIEQLIRDMEQSIAELRRGTVDAIAREKQLDKKKRTAESRLAELERKAVLALDHGDDVLARRLLTERLQVREQAACVAAELDGASAQARQLKTDLRRTQERAGVARRKKDELVRRKRAAEAQLRTQEAARRSAAAIGAAKGRVGELQAGHAAFDGYADAIHEIEAGAESTREICEAPHAAELELQRRVESSDVDEELERLKRVRASSS